VAGEPNGEAVDVGNSENSEVAPGPDDLEIELEGADAAEHVDAEADDGEQEQVDEPAPRASRGETRFQRLANEAKAAREEATRVRSELSELRRAQQQSTQQLTAEQEAARLAVMTPEERADYKLNAATRRFEQQASVLAFNSHDASDKALFEAKAVSNRVYAKYKDEVEDKLQELRSQGQNVPREQLLKWIIGDKALATAANPRPAQKAAQRVAAQQVKPGTAKGDAASQRGKTQDTPEKRLSGVFI